MSESWHLDKRVPIGMIVTLLAYGIGAVVYVNRMEGHFNERVAILEQRVDDQSTRDERRDREQTMRDERQDRYAAESMALLRAHLDRMEAKLDRLYERRNER